jgi:hypothetical protein
MVTAVTTALLLGAMPAMGPLSTTQAVADEPEAALSEGQKALAEAEASGQRVEVTGERSERTTVYGNPDGYTFTLEESAVPCVWPSRVGAGRHPMPRSR